MLNKYLLNVAEGLMKKQMNEYKAHRPVTHEKVLNPTHNKCKLKLKLQTISFLFSLPKSERLTTLHCKVVGKWALSCIAVRDTKWSNLQRGQLGNTYQHLKTFTLLGISLTGRL